MSKPPKEQKFRVSLSRSELVIFQTYLSNDLNNIIENAPLLADIQKAIRKIDFNVIEASHSSAPKQLSHSADHVAAQVSKTLEDSAKKNFELYEAGDSTLTEDAILSAIKYKTEILHQSLSQEESDVLNEYMTNQFMKGVN